MCRSNTNSRAIVRRVARASLIAGVVAVVLAPDGASGGAWVERKDSYYFKVSSSYLFSEKELNFSGDEVAILSGDTLLTNTSYRDFGISLYLEYGLSDRLTAVAALPFKVLTSRRTELSSVPGLRREVEAVTAGFGDMGVAVRYPVVAGPLPVSLQAGVKVPLGYDQRPDNGGPPLGSGRVDLEGHVLAGMSLYPFPGYVTGGLGYRVKTGDLDDELLFSIEAGASWGRVMGRVGLDGLYSTTDPPDLSRSGTGRVSSAVTSTNQDILKLSPGVALALSDEVSLVADVFHVLDGKNTVTGTTFALGVVYQQ